MKSEKSKCRNKTEGGPKIPFINVINVSDSTDFAVNPNTEDVKQIRSPRRSSSIKLDAMLKKMPYKHIGVSKLNEDD